MGHNPDNRFLEPAEPQRREPDPDEHDHFKCFDCRGIGLIWTDGKAVECKTCKGKGWEVPRVMYE